MCDPQSIPEHHPTGGVLHDLALTAHVLERLGECVQVCHICVDACLTADDVADLRHCIRLILDCGAICASTAAVVGRSAAPSGAVLQRVLDACVAACGACADECERHAAAHDHCRICAEACRACEAACVAIAEGPPAGS